MGRKSKQRRKKERRRQKREKRRNENQQTNEETQEVTEMDATPFIFHDFSPSLKAVPKIFISRDAYRDMLILVGESPIEISWLGTVEELDGGYLIKEIFLPKQECGPASTEMDTEGIVEVGMHLLNREGGDPEDFNKLRFWGHSHVNMGVMPSGTDEQQAMEFSNNPWFIRAIANKRGKIKFDLYDFKRHLRIDDLPWEVYQEEEPEIAEAWKEEMTSKVRERSFRVSSGSSYQVGTRIPNKDGTRYRRSSRILLPDDDEWSSEESLRSEIMGGKSEKPTSADSFPRLSDFRDEPQSDPDSSSDDEDSDGVTREETPSGVQFVGSAVTAAEKGRKRIHEMSDDEIQNLDDDEEFRL